MELLRVEYPGKKKSAFNMNFVEHLKLRFECRFIRHSITCYFWPRLYLTFAFVQLSCIFQKCLSSIEFFGPWPTLRVGHRWTFKMCFKYRFVGHFKAYFYYRSFFNFLIYANVILNLKFL